MIATPLAAYPRIRIVSNDDGLTAIDLVDSRVALHLPHHRWLCSAADWFSAYFASGSAPIPLTFPLAPAGTAFQRRVWSWLQTIPPGETQSYGEIARAIESGPRAVAAACRANPLPIIIPCHRVVAASGVGGYMGSLGGAELETKLWLIRHERHR